MPDSRLLNPFPSYPFPCGLSYVQELADENSALIKLVDASSKESAATKADLTAQIAARDGVINIQQAALTVRGAVRGLGPSGFVHLVTCPSTP